MCELSPDIAMPLERSAGVTTLLSEWQSGDPSACQRLVQAVHPQLRRIARRLIRHDGWTLDPTEFVDTAFTTLFGKPPPCRDSREFFSLATAKLSNLVVDHARRRLATKHGGNLKRVAADWDKLDIPEKNNLVETILVGELLDRLRKANPRQAEIVEQHYFIGLKQQEIAVLMRVSLTTVETDLARARQTLAGWHSPKKETK
jgi:RNA polymerase sigma factor (TIGR02999 family)